MLNKIKLLSGIKDNSQDELLSFKIELIKDKIMNYCNRNDVPEELNNIIIDIVSNDYTNMANPEISSISRGGVSVSFKNEKENILNDYKNQLNRFRKLGTLK